MNTGCGMRQASNDSKVQMMRGVLTGAEMLQFQTDHSGVLIASEGDKMNTKLTLPLASLADQSCLGLAII